MMVCVVLVFFFSSRERHTRCAVVTGVRTCALPIFDLVVGEVAPLVALAQAVADDHRLAALAEGGDEIGADEAGAAGDEKHGRGESLVIWRSVKKRLLIEARRKPPQPRPLPGLQGSTGRRTRLMCAPPAAILSMGRSAPRRRKDEKCRADR